MKKEKTEKRNDGFDGMRNVIGEARKVWLACEEKRILALRETAMAKRNLLKAVMQLSEALDPTIRHAFDPADGEALRQLKQIQRKRK